MTVKATFCILLSFVTACSVEDTHDLSKDIDATVAVGNGISLPLGFTEKIMLTEMIDPESSEVLDTDADGNYVIEKSGEIDATEVNVEKVRVELEPISESGVYNMESEAIQRTNEYLNSLPPAVRDQILSEETPNFTHVVNQVIDENSVKYSLKMDAPDDVSFLQKVMFERPVKMTLDIEIFTEDGNEQFTEKISKLHLHADGVNSEHFYVQMPSYILFEDNMELGPDNKLYIEGEAKDIHGDGHKHFIKEYMIKGFDFSIDNADGGIYTKDIEEGVEEELQVNGVLVSDPLLLSVGDAINIPSVVVDAVVSIEEFVIEDVYGKFNPQIEPIEVDDIDIDLGEDMDFVYEDDAKFAFSNPQFFIDINNGATIPVNTEVKISSYDRDNNVIANDVPFDFTLAAKEKDGRTPYLNQYYVTYNGNEYMNDGAYEPIKVPTLKSLLDKVPNRVEIDIRPYVDSNEVYPMVLGEPMEISGSYRLYIPMEFDELELEYTETIEDVLGEDPTEITDYITNFESVTLSADVYNTCPAEFTPEIVAYDIDGNELNGITATFDEKVAAGNGHTNEPVHSVLKIRMNAEGNELELLNTIDVKMKGNGAGVLNKNAYLQLKNINITVDKPIIVDMN